MQFECTVLLTPLSGPRKKANVNVHVNGYKTRWNFFTSPTAPMHFIPCHHATGAAFASLPHTLPPLVYSHPNLLRFAALAYFHFDASRSRGKKYERKRMKNKFYGAFVGCNEVICASYADAAVKNPRVIHMQNIKRFR